jgi:hypothetical protein
MFPIKNLALLMQYAFDLYFVNVGFALPLPGFHLLVFNSN